MMCPILSTLKLLGIEDNRPPANVNAENHYILDAGHPMSYIQRILRHKHENTTAQFTYEVLTRSCAEITGTFLSKEIRK